MCTASRYLMIAFGFGLVASSLTGSDGIGWLVAVVAVLTAYVLERQFPQRFGGTSCAVPRQASSRSTVAPDGPADPIPHRVDHRAGIEVRR